MGRGTYITLLSPGQARYEINIIFQNIGLIKLDIFSVLPIHWSHDVVATLNQRR